MDTNLVTILQTLAAASAKTGGHDNSLLTLVLIAIITAAPSVASYFKAKEAVRNVKEVHVAINSRLDKWLAVERDQGISDGRNQAHTEAREQAAAVAISTHKEATKIAAASRLTEDELRELVIALKQQLRPPNAT